MTSSMPSLLDSLDALPAVKPPRTPLGRRLAAPFERWWARATQDPARRRRTMRALWIAGGAALVGAGVGAYFLLRPVPQPDFLDDDLDSVLGYTLLTDEFNKLPVEQRLKLVGELVQRLKSMSAGDSVLMAAFAAGLAGSARDQLMENGSRLAIDAWDKFAADYDGVPDADREKYLDQAFVDFTKMMEAVGGRPRDISDEKRLEEAKAQAQRDTKAFKDPSTRPPAEALGRVFSFMNQDVGSHALPQQRARGQQMMRDMVRRMRGEDIRTGKPR